MLSVLHSDGSPFLLDGTKVLMHVMNYIGIMTWVER